MHNLYIKYYYYYYTCLCIYTPISSVYKFVLTSSFCLAVAVSIINVMRSFFPKGLQLFFFGFAFLIESFVL